MSSSSSSESLTMMLFDLNNDILIKIQEEVAIKRKHKLFLDNLKKHRDQFYNEGWYKWFDMDCFEDHLNFRNGYWYQRKYFVTDEPNKEVTRSFKRQGLGKYSFHIDWSRTRRMPDDY